MTFRQAPITLSLAIGGSVIRNIAIATSLQPLLLQERCLKPEKTKSMY